MSPFVFEQLPSLPPIEKYVMIPIYMVWIQNTPNKYYYVSTLTSRLREVSGVASSLKEILVFILFPFWILDNRASSLQSPKPAGADEIERGRRSSLQADHYSYLAHTTIVPANTPQVSPFTVKYRIKYWNCFWKRLGDCLLTNIYR